MDAACSTGTFSPYRMFIDFFNFVKSVGVTSSQAAWYKWLRKKKLPSCIPRCCPSLEGFRSNPYYGPYWTHIGVHMTLWFSPLPKLVLYIKSARKTQITQFLVLVFPFQTEAPATPKLQFQPKLDLRPATPQRSTLYCIGLISELNNDHYLLTFSDNIGIIFEICPKIIPF